MSLNLRDRPNEPESVVPGWVPLLAGGALLTLWGLSFALSYVNLGGATLPVALGIAAAKAGIVLFVFMELAREPLSIRLALLSAVVMVALLVGGMTTDVATRPAPPLLPPLPAAPDPGGD